MKILFVPQYPASMRYSEWWFWKIPQELRDRGHEVHILGEKVIDSMLMSRGLEVWFTDINMAIEFECEQIKEYRLIDVSQFDVLFHADLSFPGLFHNMLFHRRPQKCFAFCHATSANYLDYFETDRDIKFPIEKMTAKLYDKVFVGSEYHRNKIDFENAIVTYLPPPPFPSKCEGLNCARENDIISVARPTSQKIDKEIEDEVEASFGRIHRPRSHSWEEYYSHLANSKILLISSKEETFGYQIIDAVINGCIPLAPNRLCYPELLSKTYLYNNIDELCHKIFTLLNTTYEIKDVVPDILCEKQIINFYDQLVTEMEE
jgi:hypothetical protein